MNHGKEGGKQKQIRVEMSRRKLGYKHSRGDDEQGSPNENEWSSSA